MHAWQTSATLTDDVTTSSFDGITFLQRTLGSAVPVSSMVPLFALAAAISRNMKSYIPAVNGINLVVLTDRLIVGCGDMFIMLKDSGP